MGVEGAYFTRAWRGKNCLEQLVFLSNFERGRAPKNVPMQCGLTRGRGSKFGRSGLCREEGAELQVVL